MRPLFLALALAVLPVFLLAQTNPVLFPGLFGPTLQSSLRKTYKPKNVLSYDAARDVLYESIDEYGDSVRCIYTGYAHYVKSGEDPSKYVYDDGRPTGINCEHAYPQSKGAGSGNVRSDMHHLFPTRLEVNQARGNSPYGEVNDEQARKWFGAHEIMGRRPARNADAYSELGQGFFEPREAVKGNIARAIMYIYTMYPDDIDRTFFRQQLPTLLRWHQMDPPDALELSRTWAIAHYQEGKPNPYVVDVTLAERAFVPPRIDTD